MKNKITKALKNPGYAIYVLLSRYAKFNSRRHVFAHSKEYRSDSENGKYASAVINALKNQKAFENFKRSYSYREILEHVSYEQGAQYLDILKNRNDGILAEGLVTVLQSDDIGNPIKHKYADIDILLSPTTLRYLKVASDLQLMFGKELGKVAEIGCGYGGQTLFNDQLLKVSLAKLFDLPFVNHLIERYLNAHLLYVAYKTTVINQEEPSTFNLVISNYAFSELPKQLQITYIDKVLAKSEKGYLTMNSGLDGTSSDRKLSLEELRERLPQFEVFKEEPLTSHGNYIIAWGYDADNAERGMNRL